MQLLSLHPLGDAGLPLEAKALGRQGPFGEVGVIERLHRLDPAHPQRHGFEITPHRPNQIHQGCNVHRNTVLKPAAHLSLPRPLRMALAARRPLMVAPSIESM